MPGYFNVFIARFYPIIIAVYYSCMSPLFHHIYHYKIGVVNKVYIDLNYYFTYYILSYYYYYIGTLLGALRLIK